MTPRMQWLLRQLQWILPAAGIGLLLWAGISAYQWRNQPGNFRLRFSAGATGTRRHQLASTLASHAASHGLDLELVDSAGSEETLLQVASGELDLGLATGGFRIGDSTAVRQVATVGREALHLLIKREKINYSPPDLALLRSLRVNVGVPGSGVYAMACEVLEFAELQPVDSEGKGDYTATQLSGTELVTQARAIRMASGAQRDQLIQELPDAVFFLSALPSLVVKELVAAADYELVPLPIEKSFRINGLHHVEMGAHQIDRTLVAPITIPSLTYRTSPAIPASDCETLGVPLIVVAHPGLPSEAVDRLIATLYDGELARELPPDDLLATGTEYPIHPAVKKFLERRKPLAVRDVMDISQKLLSLFGAFSAGVFAVYGFLRQRRAKSEREYFAEVARIERLSEEQFQNDADYTADSEAGKQLAQELGRLRQRLIEDYAQGRLASEASFANLLALIADTRAGLQRSANPTTAATTLKTALSRKAA